ncbi:TetR/AcrR family transcriptional regulator [Zhongshania arctica]|uniref:TetR/AcrR family transcriptional regulator n=1 Tax=Zhongshania arctica TaxID=3238302 RepID=A0ABV3TY92_9GAMM
MTTSNSKISPESDGRRQRTERSRTAIIEASLSLLEEGILVPTAQQISDRAGVGIRTFFRHFEDMNTLFEAVDDSIRSHYEMLILTGDRNGTLEERIDHAVDRHAAVYEQIANIILSAAAQRWRYDVLRKNYARSQRGLRKDLDNLLPEIKDLPQSTREAIDAIASFEMWNRLREHQGQSKRSTISIVSSLLKTLIIQ